MPKVLNLTRNTKGRDYAIGDIHGYFRKVEQRLEEIGFDPRVDRLICVGDLVNRGSLSHKVAEFLSNPWVFSVMGNHDALICQGARRRLNGTFGEPSIDINTLMDNEGDWLLQLDREALRDIDQLVSGLPLIIQYLSESGEVLAGIGHAEVNPNFTWEELLECLADLPEDFAFSFDDNQYRGVYDLMWGRSQIQSYRYSKTTNDFNEAWYETKGIPLFICGHNIVRPEGGKPLRMANNLLIDHGICLNPLAPIQIYAMDDLLSDSF